MEDTDPKKLVCDRKNDPTSGLCFADTVARMERTRGLSPKLKAALAAHRRALSSPIRHEQVITPVQAQFTAA